MSCVLLQDWPASGVDSGCGIHGGVHWLQAGLRSPGYPPRSPPAKYLYYCVISGFQGGFHEGWTPKKIALTLAICRAAPPRIRLGPRRNHAGGGDGRRLGELRVLTLEEHTLRNAVHPSPVDRHLPLPALTSASNVQLCEFAVLSSDSRMSFMFFRDLCRFSLLAL